VTIQPPTFRDVDSPHDIIDRIEEVCQAAFYFQDSLSDKPEDLGRSSASRPWTW
jgi:hypothetical protein